MTEAPLQLRRILVALDASRESHAALEEAIRLAAKFQSALQGLFVEEARVLEAASRPGARVTRGRGAEPLDALAVARAFRVQARRARAMLERAARKARVPWTFAVTRGEPEREILAASQECELLIIGRVGTDAAVRRKVGSTARHALAGARCAVMVTRKRGRVSRTHQVALFSGGSERAEALARWLARERDARLVVVGDDPAERDAASRAEIVVVDRDHPVWQNGFAEDFLEQLDGTVLVV